MEELNKLESALKDTQLALANAGGDTVEEGDEDTVQEEESHVKLSVNEIAMTDEWMRQLLRQKHQMERQLGAFLTRFGKQHRKVLDERAMLDMVQQSIDDYAKVYRDSPVALVARTQAAAGAAELSLQPDTRQLSKRVRQLQELFDVAKANTLQIGRKKLEIDKRKEEAEHIQRKLTDTQQRIDQIRVESAVSGRIEVISDGDRPHTSINRGMRKQLALLGVIGGGSVGLGIMLLIGSLDRRLRSSDDACDRVGTVRLLGVLPRLPDDLSDPEHASVAGHCVHHIRSLLQMSLKTETQIVCITSPAGGTGKTSLTLALGLSFAGSGSRTLLVDCDIGGGGLTKRLNAIIRRRVGQILLRQGLLSTQQLEDSLKQATATGKRLGETLVEQEILKVDDLTEALAVQEQAIIGLLDALDGEELEQCITATGNPGLSILPVGGANMSDKGRISPLALRALIEEARQVYDTILLDTGPVPGTVETSIVAAEADQVVLVVSRGEPKPQVERAMTFLESIGARVAGFVFNRAEARDVARSVFSSSSNLSSPMQINGNHTRQAPLAKSAKNLHRFGPVAQAVVDTSNTSHANGK